jgi:CDP-diacylglycerol--glycerol-3-phosphate 3-phosphatidyltransferase
MATTAPPLFTANRVTAARLLGLPFIAWFLHRGDMWSAFVLGVLVGSTDFVDGYLARKHGVTVLGSLMDPIADKVFIAVTYMPFAHWDTIPAWAAWLLFIREFVVTALRTSYELRGLAMKTTFIAKMKTWMQMAGIGFVWLFVAVNDDAIMHAIMICIALLPLSIWVIIRVVKGTSWRTGLVATAGFTLPFPVYALGTNELRATAAMVVVLAITWFSGLDYVFTAFKDLRGKDYSADDVVRMLAALVLPTSVILHIEQPGLAVWFLVGIIAIELSGGGLDNLTAHHGKQQKPFIWGFRTLGISALLLVGYFLPKYAQPVIITSFFISLVGTIAMFWGAREHYLGPAEPKILNT